MDLRAKLARLTPLAARTKPLGVPTPEPEPESGSREPGVPPHIADLRARLGALIDRSREKQAREKETRAAAIEARLREAPLPFDERDTPLGPLHVRTVHHPIGHVVGRIPVRTGHDASPDALALLALDPTLATVDPKRALYVDTEATGLAGGTGTVPFLVGMAWFEDGALICEQLLLRRFGEESPILARVAERIAASSMLVSFNGKAFDMPLLRTRFVMNRLPAPAEPPHLDLVHLARRVHRSARGRGGEGDPRSGPTIERWVAPVSGDGTEEELRRATSCKLTALERQILGFARVDDVPSAEVPARYGHFLRTGDADAIRAVCDHNLWDVVSMAALAGVYADAIRALDEAGVEVAPETVLGGRDLVGIARTLRRAGDLSRARKAADAAVDASVDDRDLERMARSTRGALAKNTRDTETALLDFGLLSREHDDATARLELAKLFEHRLRDPARALAEAEAGTSEDPEAAEHRRERLRKKAEKVRQLELAALASAPARRRTSAAPKRRASRPSKAGDG